MTDAAVVIERTSRLGAPAEEVWRWVTTMAGVNAELAPVVMTYPADRAALDGEVPLGTPLFVSTLKLAGIAFDRHELTLVELEPGRWFQEDSTSRLQRRWRHRRTVVPTDDGCELTDRLEVEPRLPGAARPTAALVGRLFDRRHRVLAARFGGR